MSAPRERRAGSASDRAAAGAVGRSILSEDQWRRIGDKLKLSDRELQAVQSIFDDQTEAAIARALGISTHTVHTHLERLYRKLGVACRCAAVVRVFAEYLSLEKSIRANSDHSERLIALPDPSKEPITRRPSPS